MGIVLLYGSTGAHEHERATRTEIARRLAALKGYAFEGELVPGREYARPRYFVPFDTLDHAGAETLGVRGRDDLFGGVVPYTFMSTKVITHPRLDGDATAPPGWTDAFPAAVTDVVLAGYSAFSRDDAQRAGERMLTSGAVRLKLPDGVGGRGQRVVRTVGEIVDVLDELGDAALATGGIVLEENLAEVETYSVGQVEVAGLVVSYVGTQRLTRANDGAEVYGGTTLLLARGDFEALLALELPATERAAIEKARVYDRAAAASFAGFYGSRRNYDVAAGRDGSGRARFGVLEQSWRIGGASGIELAALEALSQDLTLVAVRASSHEVYGDGTTPPPGAIVYFHGTDPDVGPLLKYTLVEDHVARR